MPTGIWSEFADVDSLSAWLEESPDEGQAYEELCEAYESNDPSLIKWIAAAVLGDWSSYGLSEALLRKEWDKKRLEDDLDYYSEVVGTVLAEVRSNFQAATGLMVVTEGAVADGSEEIEIRLDEKGCISWHSDYWVHASNNTRWNVIFEGGSECLVVFEYVDGSLEEFGFGECE